MQKKKPLLNLDHVRTPEQHVLMKKIESDGVCPFCKKHFKKYHPKPILKETDHWYFTENMSPYAGTKHHFILVYKKKHITKIEEISPKAMTDLLTVIKWAVKKYKFPGGAFFIRFGDTKYTGSSVSHLHAHLLMGNQDDPKHEAVRVKLG